MEIRTYCLRQQYVHMRFADDLLNTKGMEGFMAEDKRKEEIAVIEINEEFTIKLVDCLEKCLICRHIRRFAD